MLAPEQLDAICPVFYLFLYMHNYIFCI